eukprot:5870272-Prorocentrum_lima.AAC.1
MGSQEPGRVPDPGGPPPQEVQGQQQAEVQLQMQQLNAGHQRGQQPQSVNSEEVIPQDPGHWYHKLQGARGQG